MQSFVSSQAFYLLFFQIQLESQLTETRESPEVNGA